MEFFSKLELYLLHFALLVGVVKYIWYELSPLIRDIRKSVTKGSRRRSPRKRE